MDANRLMEFLTQEGFRPSQAGPLEVRFKYEGGHYAVRWYADDEHFVCVVFPGFWRAGSDEELARCYRAASRAAEGTKVAKVLVLEDRTVWAVAELLVGRFEQFQEFFPRTLSILRYAVSRFADLMRQSEPVADDRIELRRGDITRFMHGN